MNERHSATIVAVEEGSHVATRPPENAPIHEWFWEVVHCKLCPCVWHVFRILQTDERASSLTERESLQCELMRVAEELDGFVFPERDLALWVNDMSGFICAAEAGGEAFLASTRGSESRESFVRAGESFPQRPGEGDRMPSCLRDPFTSLRGLEPEQFREAVAQLLDDFCWYFHICDVLAPLDGNPHTVLVCFIDEEFRNRVSSIAQELARGVISRRIIERRRGVSEPCFTTDQLMTRYKKDRTTISRWVRNKGFPGPRNPDEKPRRYPKQAVLHWEAANGIEPQNET